MTKTATQKIDYRGLQTELAVLLTELESDQLDIDASIAKYQRGMVIVGQLQSYLKTAQNTVAKVTAGSLPKPTAQND